MTLDHKESGMGPVSPIPGPNSKPQIGTQAHSQALTLDPVDYWQVKQRGIDTTVFRFKITGLLALTALSEPLPFGPPGRIVEVPEDADHPRDPRTGLACEVVVKNGGNWVMDLGWARVFGYPSSNLVNVDCRPSALLAEDQDVTELLHPRRMRAACEAAEQLVRKVLGGNSLGCRATIRRVDLAVDLINCSQAPRAGDDGLAVLQAFAGAALPRWFPKAHALPDESLSGVEFRTRRGRQLVFRVYDKGLERTLSQKRVPDEDQEALVDDAAYEGAEKPEPVEQPKTPARGLLLRLERQWRPTNAGDSMTLGEWEETELKDLFLGQFATWLKTESGAVICGAQAARERAEGLYLAGRITRRRLTTLVGNIGLLHDQVFADSQIEPHKGKSAAQKSLRVEGIILDSRLPRYAAVRLGDLVRLAVDSVPSSADPVARSVPDWFF